MHVYKNTNVIKIKIWQRIQKKKNILYNNPMYSE